MVTEVSTGRDTPDALSVPSAMISQADTSTPANDLSADAFCSVVTDVRVCKAVAAAVPELAVSEGLVSCHVFQYAPSLVPTSVRLAPGLTA